ncbi:MAG: hypothetical protein DRN24_03715 [Thermoplasmata archaeon]|nr:MAG: hypothetical protein DRN24_03715 [Thermoplasmata archaeon]
MEKHDRYFVGKLAVLLILMMLCGVGLNAGMKYDSILINTSAQNNSDIKPIANNITLHISDFKTSLFEKHTLSIWIESLDKDTGGVIVNGVDTRNPFTPFTWDWGDGSIDDGFFPQNHTYIDRTRNYILKVISNYADGSADRAEVLIRFVPPKVDFKPLSSNVSVIIPNYMITLKSRLPGYRIPKLTYFDDSFFNVVNRTVVEYVLSIASEIQMDFANNDVYLINESFMQYLLRDVHFGGGYTLWYTDPIAFAMGDCMMRKSIPWSSLFHEMGHDVTLNSPANYFYGGKIDGNANAIFSESMAQIFQHSTAYEIINNAKVYGLSEDLVFEIKQSAISSIMMVKNAYEEYINSGMVFSSWNDPVTERDETFNTFMTLAYKFFEHAEKSGLGYRMPLKRMMMLLQTFCEEDKERYSQFENSPEAENFRATLMVTALSFAFEEDLREEFKRLNFPVDDKIYDELINRIKDTLMTNNLPSKPIVSGSNDGHKNISYTYTIVSVDLDNDSLQYFIDWGDGSNYTSKFIDGNTSLTVNHTWDRAGRYIVKVKAFDNETFSANSSYIVYIDSLEVDDIGYLIDIDSNGIYDRFHNKSSGLESNVGYKNGEYLIDGDGDNIWDYSFSEYSGLVKHVENRERKHTPSFEIILMLLATIFTLIWYVNKKK